MKYDLRIVSLSRPGQLCYVDLEAFPEALGMPKGFLLVADFFYLFQLTGFFPVA